MDYIWVALLIWNFGVVEWSPFIGKVHWDSRHISLWSVPSWPWYLSSTSQNGPPGSSWLWFQYMVKPETDILFITEILPGVFPSSSSYLDLKITVISHNFSVNNQFAISFSYKDFKSFEVESFKNVLLLPPV